MNSTELVKLILGIALPNRDKSKSFSMSLKITPIIIFYGIASQKSYPNIPRIILRILHFYLANTGNPFKRSIKLFRPELTPYNNT